MPRKETDQGADPAQDAPPSRNTGRIMRVLQLSDTHLYANPDGRLLSQCTRRTLGLVLELARETFWPADRILLTGDLVHDESPAGYRYLSELLGRLATPCHAIPGNHDAAGLMSRTLAPGIADANPGVHSGNWNLVFLDSTVPGEDGGHLDATQLDRLEAALARAPEANALICLHHQPIPVGSPWMDTMALNNPDAFFSVLDRHPQVRGVIWGHVHQAFSGRRKGVALLGCPSTCIQFLPGSEDFAIDALTPGFRWLKLHPDGRIETGIERIAAYPDPIDLATGGY
jgi:Icc protein